MLIPYLGEKSKISNFIIPNIPKDISTYVEPFGGMFGIFFSLNFDKLSPDIKYIYNDQNHLNYLLFKYLKNEKLIELVNPLKVDEDYYKLCLQKIFTEKDELSLALYWLVILTCSSPYEIGKHSWRSSIEFDIFKMKYKAYQYHIQKITEIHKEDYKSVIERYDSESTFFYVDPPYFGKEEFYINHNFSKESHRELAKTLNSIKGRFLLSYYYFDGIEYLYPNCKFDSKITVMGTELIIKNY